MTETDQRDSKTNESAGLLCLASGEMNAATCNGRAPLHVAVSATWLPHVTESGSIKFSFA